MEIDNEAQIGSLVVLIKNNCVYVHDNIHTHKKCTTLFKQK